MLTEKNPALDTPSLHSKDMRIVWKRKEKKNIPNDNRIAFGGEMLRGFILWILPFSCSCPFFPYCNEHCIILQCERKRK